MRTYMETMLNTKSLATVENSKQSDTNRHQTAAAQFDVKKGHKVKQEDFVDVWCRLHQLLQI